MEILDVQARLDRCGDELDPCEFYRAHNYYPSHMETGCYRDGYCDNRRERGFKYCPRDKTRCCKDMLSDVFDAVDAAYRD